LPVPSSCSIARVSTDAEGQISLNDDRSAGNMALTFHENNFIIFQERL